MSGHNHSSKGQAVVMSEADNVTFDIEELVKRVKHTNETRTKKRHSIPKCNNESPRTHNITETLNSLVQVINNMISNSIQAYAGKPEQK